MRRQFIDSRAFYKAIRSLSQGTTQTRRVTSFEIKLPEFSFPPNKVSHTPSRKLLLFSERDCALWTHWLFILKAPYLKKADAFRICRILISEDTTGTKAQHSTLGQNICPNVIIYPEKIQYFPVLLNPVLKLTEKTTTKVKSKTTYHCHSPHNSFQFRSCPVTNHETVPRIQNPNATKITELENPSPPLPLPPPIIWWIEDLRSNNRYPGPPEVDASPSTQALLGSSELSIKIHCIKHRFRNQTKGRTLEISNAGKEIRKP